MAKQEAAEGSELDLTGLLVGPEGEVEHTATRMEFRNDLGRVVVSNSTVNAICTPLIRERPLLVWKKEYWNDCIDQFLDSPTEVKAMVLDMFTPPDSADLMIIAKRSALFVQRNYALAAVLPFDTIYKLIGVAITNGHEYYGHAVSSYYEIITPSRHVRSEKSALFAYGSKVAHSCCPNVSYSSKTADGCLEYKVISPIAQGDLITFSYLEDLLSTPTHERRNKLLKSKSFFCKCERCMGPDFCRFHSCPTAGCTEYVACVCRDENEPVQWSCSNCGSLEDGSEFERKEWFISNKLDGVGTKLMLPGGVGNVHPREVAEIVKTASMFLSPLHYLTLLALEVYIRVCASHAAGIDQASQMMGLLHRDFPTPFGTLKQLRLEAAKAGFQYVSACECIAAGCSGKSCGQNCGHPPAFDCAVKVFHAWQDLKDVPTRDWPKNTKSVMQRYIPYMYISFGEGDSDTKQIEEALMAIPNGAPVPVAPSSKKSTGGSRNKKKKGRKNNKKKK